MAPRQPKTKQDILTDIINDIVSTSLESQSGLYSVNNLKVQKYLNGAEKNKAGNYADYHYICALVSTVEGKLREADYSYCVAMKIDSSNIVVLGNYATLLVDRNKYRKAKVILERLMIESKLYDSSVINSIRRIAINTLDTGFLNKFAGSKFAEEDTGLVMHLDKLKKDINLISISLEEYTEFLGLVSSFVLQNTRQNFNPRFSINNGLDRNVKIEVFLNINADEASYLNTEFTTYFVDYVFDNDRHELLGKFVVFFKQEKSRYDGTENPDALYLGMNEELVA
ncbi:hypothetical protein [Psychrobacter sp. PAMC 21119]|uniref:hypothetical protein n=1 Tax=Psychrobacter sp. PAMC 21119 TaxID=1112209 RepID=UPI0002899D24|nr:hypothetical protein [Psychrobacter sp. PAMC 21119]